MVKTYPIVTISVDISSYELFEVDIACFTPVSKSWMENVSVPLAEPGER